MYACGAFSIPEQIDALEWAARQGAQGNQAIYGSRDFVANSVIDETESDYDVGVSNVITSNRMASSEMLSEADQLKLNLARLVSGQEDPPDELVAATIQKIMSLEPREPAVANIFRQLVLSWSTRAAYAMRLADLKNGKGSTLSVIGLLAERKKLRETQPTDVYDARNGVPTAAGIATCILEDSPSYGVILNDTNAEVKAAFLACSRLIRIPLPVQMVAANLNSTDKRLALASQLYLESEDSPEARNILFAHFPDQAKITGSRIFFAGDKGNSSPGGLTDLYSTVDGRFSGESYSMNYFSSEPFEKRDKQFQKEVLANGDLLGYLRLREKCAADLRRPRYL